MHSFWHHKFDVAVKCPLRKSEVCFVWKIRICTLLVKSMKVFVPLQEITSVKQKEMSRHGGMNKRIQIKILNQLNTSESFLVINSILRKILLTAPANAKLRKILESSMIALKQRSWNEQLDFDLLALFRNGVRSSVTNFYCFYFRWFNYCIYFVT